jgi:type IV pilus assembly protein PilX
MQGRERGVALLVTLLMLVAVLLLGASASTMALLGEQAARAERDRLIAFQAAEDALMDAERDIESGRSPAVPPAAAPAAPAAQAKAVPSTAHFPLLAPDTPPAVAVPRAASVPAGLPVAAARSHAAALPAPATSPASAAASARTPGEGAAEPVPEWQLVDLAGDATTPFGALSGAVMETGEGFEPFRRPRYLAERLPRPGGGFFYRITVIGFGSRADTEVVLQTTYRRAADGPPGPGGRLSWREIANWRELHAAANGARDAGEDKP